MTDFFALLDEPRRPWLETDALKQKFLDRSAQAHPDRVHGASESLRRAAQDTYAELNAAYQCLREPKDRLRHLLELEMGTRPPEVQPITSGLMDVFMEVSRLGREVDSFLLEKQAVSSPLLRVELFERSQVWTERLSALLSRLNTWRDALMRDLQEIDAAWNSSGPPGSASRRALLERLEQVYRSFAYCNRWSSQVQERITQLSF